MFEGFQFMVSDFPLNHFCDSLTLVGLRYGLYSSARHIGRGRMSWELWRRTAALSALRPVAATVILGFDPKTWQAATVFFGGWRVRSPCALKDGSAQSSPHVFPSRYLIYQQRLKNPIGL